MNNAKSPFIRFGRAVCGSLGQAERREWWLANGLGAYALGTLAGTLTRRYHGLLIAPLEPTLGRFLLFAKADAVLLEDGREWPLFSNRWADGTLMPQGHCHIESFHLDGRMPVWRFAFGDLRLELRIWLEPGAHTVYLAYRPLHGHSSARSRLDLKIRLLINARDHHGSAELRHFNPIIEPDRTGLAVRGAAVSERYLPFTLRFQVCRGEIAPDCTWYENFDLPLERERGLPDRDRHLCIGQALIELQHGQWSGLVASLHEGASPDLEEAMRRFQAHDADILTRARGQLRAAPDWIEQLALAADSFLFARPLADAADGESVIAGYPWFGDWGRDTMIALPGLTLATGRYESARRILQTFARFIDRGMLPNVFTGSGQTPEYNSADAALWYIEAWRAYVEVTGDRRALQTVFPALARIIEGYRRGTRHGIAVDASDGLLKAGEPGVQVTWMDAKVGDWVVTPRIGKPVEINALWFNALGSMAQFAGLLGQPATPFCEAAEQVRHSFSRFVRPDAEGLFDVLDGPEGDDDAIRPNQILAVSLPHSPLTDREQQAVVRCCGRELLTSYGLRSLTPMDAAFRPHYLGGVLQRDGAYHQGPVWAWLLGHYALASYRVHGDIEAALSVLEPIRDHLSDAGLGTVSEIFDGGVPHTPRGAPSQAWSVACVLEAWWRLQRAASPSGASVDQSTPHGA